MLAEPASKAKTIAACHCSVARHPSHGSCSTTPPPPPPPLPPSPPPPPPPSPLPVGNAEETIAAALQAIGLGGVALGGLGGLGGVVAEPGAATDEVARQQRAARQLGGEQTEEEAMRLAEDALPEDLQNFGKTLRRLGGDPEADSLLEEAVRALPANQPFEAVDRIEYVNAHGGYAAKGAAATPAAGGANRLRGGGIALSPPPPPAPSAFNLTVVTQTDHGRMAYLAEGARRWRGPLIAAVHLPGDQTLAAALRGRTFEPHVTLVAVSGPAGAPYPINSLRNAAIKRVATTHYIVLDVDLWPSTTLARALALAPPEVLARKYAALVLPAFQVEASAVGGGGFEAAFGRAPRSLGELAGCLSSGRCSTFYSHLSPETHSTTPYEAWTEAAVGGALLPIPCFKNGRYEPYVILPALPTTPRYSEAFTGYGKNKIELVTHLRFAGFKFFALPGAYVVHMPHNKSSEKVAWEQGPSRQRNDHLFQRLVAQLVSQYQRPRTPSCVEGRLL